MRALRVWNKFLLMIAICIAAPASFAAPVRGPSPCESLLNPNPLAFSEVNADSAALIRAQFDRQSLWLTEPTYEELLTFADSGWPAMIRCALDNQKSVYDLVREELDSLNLLFRDSDLNPQLLVRLVRHRDEIVSAARRLSASERPRFGIDEVPAARTLIKALRQVSVFAMEAELRTFGASTVNPLKPLTAGQVHEIYKALSSLAENAAKEARLAAPENSLDAAPRESKKYSSPKNSPNDQSADGRPISLSEALQDSGEFAADKVYQFENHLGEHYTITFSRDVTKAAAKGEMSSLKRLLSRLYTGDGIKAGIKMLSSLGRNVIEIKAVMHGHKRLIGCLKGRHLEIKRYFDGIGDSVAAYHRVIPANFCE